MDTAKLTSGAKSVTEERQTLSGVQQTVSEQLKEISTYLYLDSRRYDSNIDGGLI